jgi:hypothetical protein
MRPTNRPCSYSNDFSGSASDSSSTENLGQASLFQIYMSYLRNNADIVSINFRADNAFLRIIADINAAILR